MSEFVNAGNNHRFRLSSSMSENDTDLPFDPLTFEGTAPEDFPFLLTINSGRSNMEIVKAIGIGSDLFTYEVKRGQEGTTAQAHEAGSIVENNFTAGTYQALVDEIKALKQQSGIVEMGENSNGQYIRYENGIQMCWHESDNITTADRSSGSIFWGDRTFTFPKEFIETPNVTPHSRRDNGVQWSGLADADESSCRVYIFQSVEGSGYGGFLGYKAIGRWK